MYTVRAVAQESDLNLGNDALHGITPSKPSSSLPLVNTKALTSSVNSEPWEINAGTVPFNVLIFLNKLFTAGFAELLILLCPCAQQESRHHWETQCFVPVQVELFHHGMLNIHGVY